MAERGRSAWGSTKAVAPERLRATMCGGEMLTPSVLTCVMALAHLERHGLI